MLGPEAEWPYFAEGSPSRQSTFAIHAGMYFFTHLFMTHVED